MKQINFIYESEEHLEEMISKEKFIEENLLIFLFSDESIEKIQNIIKSIKSYFPASILAGASSAGTINEGKTIEGRSLVVFYQFEKIIPQAIIMPSSEYSDQSMALEIKNKIVSDQSKLLFLFNDGLDMNSHILLNEIDKLMPNLPLAGGKAGNNSAYDEITYVFLNNQVIKNGAVAITLNGDYLRLLQTYRLNWKRIGKKMVVTEAYGNILKSVDGIPILELYEKYLGKNFVENFPEKSGMEFPFIMNRGGLEIARSPAGKLPDGTVLCHGDIKVGDEVYFGFGNIPIIIDEVDKECLETFNFQPEGITIFSCLARKNLLGRAIEYENETFARKSPTAGFFTFGEFFHKNSKNYLLNITMTILLLSEKPIDNNLEMMECNCAKIKIVEDRKLNTSKTLIHLVEQVSSELEQRNEELKILSDTDGLTGLYNHRFFRESIKHEIARAIRYNKKLSLMILDLDDFKIVNDTYGHTEGDKVLQKVGESIKERCRETDIVCRYGGDEIVIILPETDKKEADEVAKRILAKASELEFLDRDIKISLSYGISELDPDNPENLLIQADDRLYDVKRNNKDKESK